MKPLANKRVVVTRSQELAAPLCQKFEQLGATAVCFPVIQFAPLKNETTTRALAQLNRYDWILFTSVNAVRFFKSATDNASLDSCSFPRIAAVGSATQKALEAEGLAIDFLPKKFTGEALAAGLGHINGQRILLPRARIGRPDIVARLAEAGALVDDVPLYDTLTAVPTPSAWADLEAGADALTFTSPSSVRNLDKLVAKRAAHLEQRIKLIPAICIGPSTAEEAKACGFFTAAVPTTFTIDGLVSAVVEFFEN